VKKALHVFGYLCFICSFDYRNRGIKKTKQYMHVASYIFILFLVNKRKDVFFLILISLLLLFEKVVNFIHRKIKILYLKSISCLILFILDSVLITNVSLKWGIWLILNLNLIGMLIYIIKKNRWIGSIELT
jgi:hypothetical protein